VALELEEEEANKQTNQGHPQAVPGRAVSPEDQASKQKLKA
jgi:hypothetical protein